MADTGAFDLWGGMSQPGNPASGTIYDYRSPPPSLGYVNPFAMALWQAGQGMLAASGPSPYPVGLGAGLAKGIQGGTQGLFQAQQYNVTNALKELEVQKAQRQAALENLALSHMFPTTNPFAPATAPAQAPQEAGPLATAMGISPKSAEAIGAPWAAMPALASGIGAAPTQAPAPALAPAAMPTQTPIAGVNPTAALLALAGSGNPGFLKLAEFSQQATKPTDRQREAIALGYTPGSPQYNAYLGTSYNQGGAWQVDANGGIRLAPGYAEGMGAVKAAEEAAKAKNDLVEVPAPGGGTRMMPRDQAVRLLGGGASGTPNAPAPVSAAPGLSPRGYGYKEPAAQQAAATRFAQDISGEFAKVYGELQRADFNAPQTIGKYRQLSSLLGQVNTGKFTGNTTDIKAAAKSVGIDLGALGIADDVAPAQASRALSNALALELRNPAGGAGMPGALSDSDRRFLESMVPGLENDPSAIKQMIDWRVKLAEREQQVAKMARQYRKSNGGKFDDGFYDQLATWSAQHPLFTQQDRTDASGGFKVIRTTPAR